MFKKNFIKKEIIKNLVDDAFCDKQIELEKKEQELEKKEIIVVNDGKRLINEVRTSQELADKIKELQEEKEKCKRVSLIKGDDNYLRAKQIEFVLEFIKWLIKK